MAHRILIVEDDRDIRISLRMLLEEEGYEVVEAPDGESALDSIGASAPSLVLLDLRLPGMSGFDVCHAIRRNRSLPIVIVSAQSDSFDVVAGLEAGADDFVIKPYVAKELSARIRANIRRVSTTMDANSSFKRGEFDFRIENGEVYRGDDLLSLTPSEFRLLQVLAQRPGQVYDRAQIASLVWNYDYLGESRLVDVHVRRLRLKIEDDPSNPKFLLTMRGLGYKFIIPA